MIMEQHYDGIEQYTAHFYYNLPAFRDERYIKVDGKPIFVIWNPNDHPDEIALFIKTWRELAEKENLKGIHFVGKQAQGCKLDTLVRTGFDAAFQSREEIAINGADDWTLWHRIRNRLQLMFGITVNLNKADFGKRYKLLANDEAKLEYVYPQLCAGYDRTPRAGRRGQLFYNFTPETWRKHIQDILRYTKEKPYEHSIIMLKSWNEWGESNYMEPDLKYGTAMLDTLREEIHENP